jgi:hypothetical protein
LKESLDDLEIVRAQSGAVNRVSLAVAGGVKEDAHLFAIPVMDYHRAGYVIPDALALRTEKHDDRADSIGAGERIDHQQQVSRDRFIYLGLAASFIDDADTSLALAWGLTLP